ncbi:MAG: hypothetical protein KA712_21070 [Myxococcales bacterium]|jgi:hypothetical protein|nr:hypothetical protein [Myxococcales bacterium]MCG5051500.1 hypothetical protein [Myxococcales bacterium]MCG5052413.1 hypothetical protein [Myxococcales bacterium]MCG5052801.1 hypothetical protein [Myxococcales bacterium]MCG5052810.1 hypothetical protein [Myxococcales bacterium]
MRVARYYCPTAHRTFSLLPDCLASRLSGSLEEVEAVVTAVEAAPSIEAAADRLRPDIELPGAVRWVRRRYSATRAALLVLVTSTPALLGNCEPTLAEVRQRLGTPVLRHVRAESEKQLGALPAPVGFGPRSRAASRLWTPREHETGPDPPP